MKKRLYRTDNDRKLAGVCGGIAEYFDWDPSLVRVIFVFSCLLWGAGVLLYVLAWIIVPIKSKVIDVTKENN